MSKLHVERGLYTDCGGEYACIADEWGNEIVTSFDNNEYLDLMAMAPELLDATRKLAADYRELRKAFYKHRESNGDCPLLSTVADLFARLEGE